ncbi:hypothetical protein AALF15_06490 [Corynebacteriaceae bacterium 7-707]
MQYPTSITRPLVRLFDWYRRPGTGVHSATDSTVLGVLPGTRSTQAAQAPQATITLRRDVRPEHTGPNIRVFSPADLGAGTDAVDVVGLLVDEGRTPATPQEVRAAFRSLTGRRPTTAEATAACTAVAAFGLLA